MLRYRPWLRRTKAIAARRFLTSSRDPPPLLPQRRVVVTGLGLVTPLACGVELSWQRLLEKKSGVRALAIEDLKIDNMDDPGKQEILNQITSKVVATVPVGSGKGQYEAAMWMDGKEKYIAPFIGYALCAAEEALLDANWHPEDAGEREKTGVAIGGGIGCISDILNAAQLVLEKRVRRLSPFFVPRILINMASGHVSIKYGFKGPNHAAVTACATGAHSVGDAARMIRFGDADVMVAGGTECSIDALSIAGFCRARALSTNFNAEPGTSSRPFDRNRDGFVMGEGAGIMVLEEYEHAKRREAKIYAEICGYGMSGDAYHITQPSNDGRGAILAMKRALKQSGLQLDQIEYVNAHATSTPLGDAIEAKAIQDVFLDHATSGALALSSTKGATGHMLGAAGAVEAIFSVLALHHGTAPPTANLTSPDPIFSGAFTPITSPKQMSINAVLTNSFGFGGTNASLVFASLQG